MSIRIFNFPRKNGIWIYSVLILLSLVAAITAVKNIKISPDSMRYALISQQIIAGKGISIPIIRLVTESGLLYDNIIPVEGIVPFLEQPPLIPALLALMGGLTAQNFIAAQILNALSHLAIAVFTFMLMKKIYNNGSVALLTGLMVAISFPLLRVTHHIWSETVFIAFTVGAMYFLVLSRHSTGNQHSRNLFLSGIFTSAAVLTRYAGIAIVPVFLWEAFNLIKNKHQKTRLWPVILATAMPILTTLALFSRNYVISGTIRGVHQPGPERTLLSALTGTLKMTFLQFQLGERPVILIAIFILLLSLYLTAKADARRGLSKFLLSGLDSIIMFIISYTALIAVIMAFKQPRFELRYMSPLVPFIFIIGVSIVVFLREMVQLRGFAKLSFYGLILSLALIASGNCYKTYLNLPEFSYKQVKQYSILDFCTYKWLKDNYQDDVIITTNRPYHLSFFGGYSTIALPHRRFDPNIGVPADMESLLPLRMSDFESQLLVMFEEVEEKYDGNYIAGLFNSRKSDDTFSLIHDCPDGLVFILRD